MSHEFVKNRYEELVNLRGATNWADVRTPRYFRLEPVRYSFGVRNTYVPIDRSHNVNLQDSRGNGISDGQTLESYLGAARVASERLEESDSIRVDELREVMSHINQVQVINAARNSLAEVGFRNPRLLRHYGGEFAKVVGYDISSMNVEVGRELGYDCHTWDLNDPEGRSQGQHDVILCYHVLEHTYDPPAALKRIRDALTPHGVLHIEIPVEPGLPRLNYGHLIALESGDLKSMLVESGFLPVSFSTRTHTGGTHVERIAAIRSR